MWACYFGPKMGADIYDSRFQAQVEVETSIRIFWANSQCPVGWDVVIARKSLPII